MIDPTGHEVNADSFFNPDEPEIDEEDIDLQDLATLIEEEPEWDSEMEWEKEESLRLWEEEDKHFKEIEDEPF